MTAFNFTKFLENTTAISRTADINAICTTQENFYNTLHDLCSQASQSKPILCIAIALFLDIVEYAIRERANMDASFKIGDIEFTLRNFVIFLSGLKSVLMLTALFFLIFGSKMWG